MESSPVKPSQDNAVESSQTSSSLPSPVQTTLDKVCGWKVDFDSQLMSSQGSSLALSPMVTTLGQVLSGQMREAAGKVSVSMEHICDRLRAVTKVEKIRCLNILLPQMVKGDLSELGEDIAHHVAKVFGEYCQEKIKKEADYFRSKRSRDEDDDYMSAAGVLTKKLKIEEVHIFYESSTGKSGRKEGKNQDKVAPLQATFYECLLKGSNLQTIGAYQMSKMNKLKSKVSSRAVYQEQAGGSYTFHQSNLPTPPLEMSFNGPLIRHGFKKNGGESGIFH